MFRPQHHCLFLPFLRNCFRTRSKPYIVEICSKNKVPARVKFSLKSFVSIAWESNASLTIRSTGALGSANASKSSILPRHGTRLSGNGCVAIIWKRGK